MPGLLDNIKHWRARAEEARTIAEEITDPFAKRSMLKVAEGYEELAVYAELRGVGLKH